MFVFWPPIWLQPAQSDGEKVQKSVIVSTSEKPLTDTNHYQDILVTKDDIKEMIRIQFTLYGLVDQIPIAEAVIACESGFRVDPLPHNGISWGIAQFTPDTWKDFGTGDIMNPYWQIKTMAKMWKMGLQNRWDCFSGKR